MLREKRERNIKILRLWLEFGDTMTLEQIGRLVIAKGEKPLTKQRIWQIIEHEKTREERQRLVAS